MVKKSLTFQVAIPIILIKLVYKEISLKKTKNKKTNSFYVILFCDDFSEASKNHLLCLILFCDDFSDDSKTGLQKLISVLWWFGDDYKQ